MTTVFSRGSAIGYWPMPDPSIPQLLPPNPPPTAGKPHHLLSVDGSRPPTRVARSSFACRPSAPEMSRSAGKRVGTPLADAGASAKRPRRSRHPSLSPSPSQERSQAPSPSQSRSRSRSQLPLARRSPPSYIGSPNYGPYDNRSSSRSRSRSGSLVSEEMDGNGRPVWRPHSYREHSGGHGDGEYSVRIGDYDRLFVFRSCHRMLSSPVYECPDGHVTCSTCRTNIGDNRCNYCAANGCVRSRAVEEFLGRISFSCRNQQYGCEVFLLHHEMRAHERTCHYDPCFCPVHRCGFAGPAYDLESHLATIHRWEVINFRYGESFEAPAFNSAIFRCEDYGELFHISSSREGLGTALSMICIRPDNACKEEFTYELKMPAGGQPHRLQIQSTVWNTSLRYGISEGSDVFLLIPDKLPGVENGCAIEVCIRKVVSGN